MCKPDGQGGTYAELHFSEVVSEKDIENMFAPTQTQISDYVSVREAAQRLHLSRQAVYEMLKRKKCRRFIPNHKEKGLRVNIKDLEQEMLAGVYE